MKKHLYLFLAVFAALSFTACDKDDDDSGNQKDKTFYNTVGLEMPAPKGGKSIIVTHYGTLRDYNAKNKNLEIISGANYSVEWDTEKSSQRWSCYKLWPGINYSSNLNIARYYASNSGTLDPSCQYPNDLDLPEAYRFQAGQDPYKYSGYDHGHICPSADRLRAVEANYQTFYITNMQPQFGKRNNIPGFNDQIWASMEGQVRNWVSKFDTLYICKGGTIDKESDIIEYVFQSSHQKTRVNNKHIPVPRYFFMAVLGRKGSTFKATGFWIDQSTYDSRTSSNTPKSYAVNIETLQQKTGIDFFYKLPDDIESQAENVSYTQMIKDWY